MSSGGQNGTTLGGLQGMRLRDASDVLTQTKVRLAYITNNSSNSGYIGVNAYRSKGVQNSYNFLLQVQQGLRECGVNSNGVFYGLTGTPFAFAGSVVTQPTTTPGSNVTLRSTLPVKN
jgi:hypothetical protein